MTDSELNELESKARAATSGPWTAHEGGVFSPHGYTVAKAESTPSMDGRSLWDRKCQQAEFIASASPSVILALIAEIRTLRDLCERAE